MLKTLTTIGAVAQAETLIFSDDFNKLDLKTWKHEITMGGGGNWEFEMYSNNRTNSFVQDGALHIQPTLTSEFMGEDAMMHGDLNLWGGTPADLCTSNAFYGCERNAAGSGNYINPIRSARVRTAESFSFKYGRVEVSAQLPKGDWIWPAIWMLPTDQAYGSWPASGEIDIMESRGNSPSCSVGGSDTFASTLHWGPAWDQNKYELTHAEYKHSESLGDGFHTYGLLWTADRLITYIDTEDNVVLDVDMSTQSFWERGGFSGVDNPWKGADINAPFDQEFYLIFNVAVGGVNGYFPDGQCGKPWSDTSAQASNVFYNTKSQWYPSWNYPASNDAAMKIDSVKVWSLDETEIFSQ